MHERRGHDDPGRALRAPDGVGERFRVLALIGLIGLIASCGRKDPPPAEDPAPAAISKAARFLWSQQGPDGGWRSVAYGLLGSGQSLTPFVLATLLQAPGVPPGGADRAAGFIRSNLDRDGALGRSDPTLEDYPNYATALGVVALLRARSADGIEGMIAGLRRQQFSESLEWKLDHPVYGAWGMGGPLRRPPHTGHVDLSMTRHVLEAFAEAGIESGDEAYVRAALFLKRCQNADGGFFFSTVIPEANKAGLEGQTHRSYGTATADGLLSLLAAGVPRSDPRVDSALAWLVLNHRIDRVPGFPEGLEQDWASGMVFYYLAASAKALARLVVRQAPEGRDWRKEMVAALVSRQEPDGRFRNPSFLMKEDDPLIATTLALSALLDASRR